MSDFNRAELRELRLRARPVSVDAGEFLFREAEAGECLYLIRRGQIEILSGQTSLRRIALRGKGEVIGEMALLDAGQRSASARATRRKPSGRGAVVSPGAAMSCGFMPPPVAWPARPGRRATPARVRARRR